MTYDRKKREAMILVVVLIVVFMLSLSGLSFVVLMSTENKAVHLRGKELQAQCLLESGEAAVMEHIQQLRSGKADGETFCGTMVTGDKRNGRGGRFSVVSPKIEDGRIEGFRFGIENESARLNLNVLSDWEKQRAGSARNALSKLPGMTDQIADAILDWTDADTQTRANGAEAEYYSAINMPYQPRGAAPGCLEELLLVKGVSRSLFCGADLNCNYTIEPQEKSLFEGLAGVSDGAVPWASLLTIYSAERNLKPDGGPRIDVNQQDLATLYEELGKIFDQSLARFIVLYRQFGPCGKNSGGKPADIGQQGPLAGQRIDFSQPGRHRLETLLDLVDAEIEIPGGKEAGENKTVRLKSPLENNPASLEQALNKLLDNATVYPEAAVRGRINVDLAPQPILESIPTLDDAAVSRILSARDASCTSGPHRHATWLLHEGLVNLQQMKAMMPYVTSGGDVYRAQIVGFFDLPAVGVQKSPVARGEIVVDATGERPQRVYWRDLRILGPGFLSSSLGGVGEDDSSE